MIKNPTHAFIYSVLAFSLVMIVVPTGVMASQGAGHLASEKGVHPTREVARFFWRISATEAAQEEASSSGEEPETIGEKPELGTAQEASLRSQELLLKPKELTLEIGVFYTKSEQDGITTMLVGPDNVLASFQSEQDTFSSSISARLGLPNRLQLSVSAPFFYTRNTFSTTAVGTSITEASKSSQSELGDISLALSQTVVRAGVGYPDVILSLRGQIPTGEGSYGVGGGIVFTKRYDPVALFANLSYQHIFSREFKDVSRLQPENTIRTVFGYALSLNDTVAISTAVSGTFIRQTTFDDPSLPTIRGRERFSLQLWMTILMTERVYIEPSLSFSLNGPSLVTLGLSIPYTFDFSRS